MKLNEAYKTLGLKPGTIGDNVKARYKDLALKNHPDKGGNGKNFVKIREAYELIFEEEKKLFEGEIEKMGEGKYHFRKAKETAPPSIFNEKEFPSLCRDIPHPSNRGRKAKYSK